MTKSLLFLILICSLAYSFFTERYYQATGVLVTQKTDQGSRSRGFNINALYIKIDQNEISIFGQQTGKTIRKNFDIYRTDQDTIYLNVNERNFQAEKIKIYFKDDTLYSNTNFLSDGGPSEFTEVKVTLRELDRNRDHEITDLFR